MKSVTSSWKECIVSYDKTMEDGTLKKVKEIYVVPSSTFTEAEACIIKWMGSYSKLFEVININPAVYKEIFFSEDPTADKWYKAKLQFITIDERSEKEKRTNVYYLVNAPSFEQARRNICEVMDKSWIDYVIAKVEETKIIDVYDEPF